MQKISGLIGKEAITLADASCRGTVLNVYFDAELTKCKYFTLASDESEEVEWVAFKNLCSLNNDAVVIKSESCIKDCPDCGVAASPINLPAFNQDGVLLGVIRDIELDGDKTVNIITDLKTVPASTLLSMSTQLLVFNDSDQPVKLKKSSKKSTADFTGQKSRAVIPSPPKKSGHEFINPQPISVEESIAEESLIESAPQNQADITKKTKEKTDEIPFTPPEFAFYRQAVELMTKTAESAKKEPQRPLAPIKETPAQNTTKNAEFTEQNFISNSEKKQQKTAAFAEEKQSLNTDEPSKNLEFYSGNSVQNTTKKGDWLSGREVQTPAKIPPQQTSVYRSPLEENIKSRYGFLLGKRIQRPIYGGDGQILAHENALVDEKIIRRVKENGKLVMLALHSL